MHLNKNIEEALSYIWEFKERGIEDFQDAKKRLREKIGEDLIGELVENRYVSQIGEKLSLTEHGNNLARDIIRRQRLAERLLVDVLEIPGESVDSIACEFEHIISPEVERSICTLLGHPKLCPHGSPLPEGECCRKQEEFFKSIVVALDKLRLGEHAKIAYMLTTAHPDLHKLLSLGIAPATIVKVHQTFPTLVLEVGEQQIALDKKLAANIYVKKV